MAAGTRTAPDVTTAATLKQISLRYIDSTGDLQTASKYVPVAATSAQVEALADAMVTASQASMYEIHVDSIWSSVPDKSNAASGSHDSVFNNVVTLVKNAARQAYDWFIPAPDATLLTAGSDQIDPASTELAAVYTALLALDPAGYGIVQARFSEHKETNKAVKI